MLDLRPDVGPFGALFARESTVKGVLCEVIWGQEDAEPSELQIGSSPSSQVNRRIVAWVRRDQVMSLARGDILTGGPAHHQKTWRVHSVDTSDPDYHIAVVVTA